MTDYLLQLSCVLFLQDLEVKEHNDFFLNEWSDYCFQMYKAILLIPDVFNHKHTKLLANLLLERLGFGSAILHQVCTSVTLYQRFFCAILQ